ncbi:MAG: four helix bundle protein [Bacteroidota bacterium]
MLWDVNVNPENALRVLDGTSTESGRLDRTAIYVKLLGSYSWHTLLRIIPTDHLTEALSDDVLQRLWPVSLRKRYEYARGMLSGAPDVVKKSRSQKVKKLRSNYKLGVIESGTIREIVMEKNREFLPAHRKLDAWKTGIELVTEIYAMTRSFPKEEVYGLVSQMRRAAVSVPANIAEGAASTTDPEYLRFLGIARKSLMELDTELVISCQLGYVDYSNPIFETWKKTSYLLNGLIKYLRSCQKHS